MLLSTEWVAPETGSTRGELKVAYVSSPIWCGHGPGRTSWNSGIKPAKSFGPDDRDSERSRLHIVRTPITESYDLERIHAALFEYDQREAVGVEPREQGLSL